MNEDLADMSLDKLRRRRDQAWQLAGYARQDRDHKDEARWTEEARRFAAEIEERTQ